MREYDTGATRSELSGKPQYEGYLSPLAVWRFGQYMLAHQKQEDGNGRAADNWQKGIPKDDYMDSLLRHVMDLWLIHRGFPELAQDSNLQNVLCAVMFNVQGYLHEDIKGGLDDRRKEAQDHAMGYRDELGASSGHHPSPVYSVEVVGSEAGICDFDRKHVHMAQGDDERQGYSATISP